MDLKDSQDAAAFLKLLQEPFEGTIDLEGQEPIKVWIHPLTPREELHVAQCWGEAYKWLKDQGGEEESTVRTCNMQQADMIVYYSLHAGKATTSTKVFSSIRELMAYKAETRISLYGQYVGRFLPSEEDLGNSLRARIEGSQTTSNSPAPSPVN